MSALSLGFGVREVVCYGTVLPSLVPKFFWESCLALFQSKIRRTKRDLIIKLITLMDGKSRDESIKPN